MPDSDAHAMILPRRPERSPGLAPWNLFASLVLLLLIAAVFFVVYQSGGIEAWRAARPRLPLALASVLVQAVIGVAIASLLHWWLGRQGLWCGLVLVALGLAVAIGQPGWARAVENQVDRFGALAAGALLWSPFLMLLTLAALAAIPASLYEAAAVDRARRWLQSRTITLPLIVPVILLGATFRLIDALRPTPPRSFVAAAYLSLMAAIVMGALVAHARDRTRSRR